MRENVGLGILPEISTVEISTVLPIQKIFLFSDRSKYFGQFKFLKWVDTSYTHGSHGQMQECQDLTSMIATENYS